MISIVIPTRNRADLLNGTLESLKHQSQTIEHEIVVVDNGSNDGTPALVTRYQETISNLVYIFEPQPGLHNARHSGLKKSKGEILAFIDDDIEVNEQWLSTIHSVFTDVDVVLAGGNCIPKYIIPPPQWLDVLWNRPVMNGRVLPELSILELPVKRTEIDPFFIWGCNFCTRRSLIISAGGFHPDGLPETLLRYRGDGESHIAEFVVSRKLKSVFDPNLSIKHLVTSERMSLRYFSQRSFREGISLSYTAHRKGWSQNPVGIYTGLCKLILSYMYKILRTFFNENNNDLRKVMLNKFIHLIYGIIYHNFWVITDPKLKPWILRKSYLSD